MKIPPSPRCQNCDAPFPDWVVMSVILTFIFVFVVIPVMILSLLLGGCRGLDWDSEPINSKRQREGIKQALGWTDEDIDRSLKAEQDAATKRLCEEKGYYAK